PGDPAFSSRAVVVGPADPDGTRALFGGAECSMGTIDDGATFQISSSWLPPFDAANDQRNGQVDPLLPYVHADWHAGLAFVAGGELPSTVVFAGTDGGFLRPPGPNNLLAGQNGADSTQTGHYLRSP